MLHYLPALKGQDDVRKYPKAVGKLRKAAESAKDILSANAKYQIGVEALHDDRDLRIVREPIAVCMHSSMCPCAAAALSCKLQPCHASAGAA